MVIGKSIDFWLWRLDQFGKGLWWLLKHNDEVYFARKGWKYTPSWENIHREIDYIRRIQKKNVLYCQEIKIEVDHIEVRFVAVRNLKTKSTRTQKSAVSKQA